MGNRRVARGVVLIVGPWNYPLQLILLPLIGAISAGNVAVVKPSEIASNVSEWCVKALAPELDSSRVKFVTGGVEETTILLKQKWDYIFFTGNKEVGKIVMQAAAENMTPLTLELGGKCPVVVHPSADLAISAKRIIMSKFLNMGQTCVAPDFVIVHESIESKLIDQMKETLIKFYGKDPQKSKDLSRIINANHFSRLKKMLQQSSAKENSKPPSSSSLSSAKIIHGGKMDASDLWIEPTLVQVSSFSNLPLLNSEIFGPILPILTYSSDQQLFSLLKHFGHPLAIYVFGTDIEPFAELCSTRVHSAALCINDCIAQATCRELPFGGVGSSGFGNYYGKYTFDTFSHQKSVLRRTFFKDPSIRFPPHNDKKIFAISKLQPISTPSPVEVAKSIFQFGTYFAFPLFALRNYIPRSRL